MSSFPGQIEEIPGISVDRFVKENLESLAYFLSHCHSDHMEGLNTQFIEGLTRNNKLLYCSEITKKILIAKLKLTDSSVIKCLNLLCPVVIELERENNSPLFFTVTPIPAGHCPGSIMLLFERNNQKILYTGDFRINSNDLPKLKPLHDYDGRNSYPMEFDKIYLDTTFLNLEFSKIPTRKESVEEIKKAAKEWLQKDPKNVVLLKLTYIYGLEYVFKEVSTALNKRIHVTDDVYEVYCQISEIAPFVTNNPHKTSIHACMTFNMFRKTLSCRLDIDESNILSLHITTFKWKGKLNSGTIAEWDKIKQRQFSVCYSSHASCDELKAFLQYFPAKQVYPCVLPKNPDEHDVIYGLLAEFTGKKSHKKQAASIKYEFKFPNPGSSAVPFKSEIFSDDDSD